MAILYTNNLGGSDTTGDGTIALPYKTINKAMTVGTNGDEIRVAGSGFTALAGTVTATATSATTWNTSVDLVGVLFPQDIITVNDAEFGDQKFFYKVQTVTSTQITVDGAWNRTPNVALTFSYITEQHYKTAATNVTFENITVTGKTNFKITGGWTNSFTAQDGWTVMAFAGASATARSGTAFTLPNGGVTGEVYIDKFMWSHLNTGMPGGFTRWYCGTLAVVYFTGTSPFGAIATTIHPYGIPDLYLTNSVTCNALAAIASNVTNGRSPLQYNNVWYANTASPTVGNTLPQNIVNYYGRSNFASGVQQYGIVLGNACNIDNLFIATQGTSGSVENVVLFSTGGSSNGTSINNDIQISGNNLSGVNLIIANSLNNAVVNNIKLSTKKIEDFRLVSQGSNYISNGVTGTIFDIEGQKQVFSSSGIAFADPTVYDTGTNSLRLSKIIIANAIPTRIPINSFYNDTSTAKTITIRAKASASTNAIFCLQSSKNILEAGGNAPLTSNNYKPQTFSLTTSWADYTYTQLDADTSDISLNSYIRLCVVTSGINADYIWIDSVTIT
jgi:hypothetical protein